MRQLQRKLKKDVEIERSMDTLTTRVGQLETKMAHVLENQKILNEGQNEKIKPL